MQKSSSLLARKKKNATIFAEIINGFYTDFKKCA